MCRVLVDATACLSWSALPWDGATAPPRDAKANRPALDMAYWFSCSVKTRNNLNYRFKGGNLDFTVEGLKDPHGRPIKGACLQTFLLMSWPVPREVMAAVPTRLVVRPATRGFIPDFGKATMISSWVVSERFARLVEELEPNVHQFIPFQECVDNKGQPIGRSFFLMNILTRLSAVDIERSAVKWQTTRFSDGSEQTTLVPWWGGRVQLTLKRDVIGNHHLWRGGKDGLIAEHFMSDQLHDAMERHGLSPLWAEKCEES
jgi:hypothetical protein